MWILNYYVGSCDRTKSVDGKICEWIQFERHKAIEHHVIWDGFTTLRNNRAQHHFVVINIINSLAKQWLLVSSTLLAERNFVCNKCLNSCGTYTIFRIGTRSASTFASFIHLSLLSLSPCSCKLLNNEWLRSELNMNNRKNHKNRNYYYTWDGHTKACTVYTGTRKGNAIDLYYSHKKSFNEYVLWIEFMRRQTMTHTNTYIYNIE